MVELTPYRLCFNKSAAVGVVARQSITCFSFFTQLLFPNNRTMQRIFLAIFLAALSLNFIGCGTQSHGTIPVSITITQKGSPLEGATVTLLSADGNSTSGLTDSSGVATMETIEGWKGALPGEYGVSIKKWESRTVPSPSPDSPDDTRSIRENKLPEKYGEHSSSGFKLTVGKKAVQETFDIPD